MARPQVRTRTPGSIQPTIHAQIPETAMILAAGLGKRMEALTKDRPKPMVPLRERPLVDHVIEKLAAAGIKRLVINLHHQGHVLRDHLRTALPPGMSVDFSKEPALLDTGGGIRKALPLLGSDSFFVVNGDIYWRDGTANTLARMAQHWDDARMDALLLMMPTVAAAGYEGLGDFHMETDGKLARRSEGRVSPFLFGGIELVHPRLFDHAPEGPFSMNLLWDKAIEAGRLYGVRHEGDWMHIGTPGALEVANSLLAD